MSHSANQRPADTQEILQRLAEIKQILNDRTSSKTEIGQSTSLGTLLKTEIGQFTSLGSRWNRRQFIGVAGLGVAGLVGGVIVHHALTYSQTINWKDLPPPPSGKKLQDFDFELVTLDSQGKENSRKRRQAKSFTEDLGPGIRLEMVAIPGGSLIMGSSDTEEGRGRQESPLHPVSIKPFYVGKFAITQAQWKAVATLDKVNRNLNADPSNFKGDNLPVERVSWYDVQEFCARLSRETGHTYRLPSEAQWEYACRAGTTTPFHLGKTITTNVVNYNGNYTYGSAPTGEYRHKTITVGSFRVPNAFGLSNMHGNVWEWCEDRWHDNYNGAPMDGSAWVAENESDNRSRVLRGGSWHDQPKNCRSAYRVYYEPGFRNLNVGFRVVCVKVS
ncbi:MAG: formylglycine-generating enzyme family protein [Symploca sp. SIO2E6]|nr:formylglycine-generating enzyme family protein [Symploca sp. SIO2E6]